MGSIIFLSRNMFLSPLAAAIVALYHIQIRRKGDRRKLVFGGEDVLSTAGRKDHRKERRWTIEENSINRETPGPGGQDG
jgi:hypothetical protein